MSNTPKINLENMESEQEKPEVETQESKQDSAKLQEEINKLKNDLLFAIAETENLRKRHLKEKEDLSKFAVSSALSELSVPFEHLFSALKVEVPAEMKENAFINSIFEGVVMVQKEFEKVFGKLGLKRINPEGEKFNPNLHQAISVVENEGVEAGMVINVISAGFELNGRLLKPAMVVVSK